MNAVMTLAAPRWGHIGDNGWGDGFWIFMIIWLALAVVVTWLAFRSVDRQAAARESTGAEQARDSLAGRHAKGEISTEEYSRRLAHIP